MSFDPALLPGDTLTNVELAERFRCSQQGGMRRSHTTNTLILISDPFKATYQDQWHGDVFHYTGMGLTGDQNLNFQQNRTLNELATNGVKAFLFEVFEPRKYTFIGQVQLAAQPYQAEQEDNAGTIRSVWVFPLKLASGSTPYKPSLAQIQHVANATIQKARRLSDEVVKRRAQKARGQAASRQVTTVVFERDSYVSDHAKRLAKGICQLCEQPAPFKTKEGEPYLETHHIDWLSEGGDDTLENTVALCPNCHRKMHALNLPVDKEKLKRVVSALTSSA